MYILYVSIWFYLENDICASCYDSRGGMPLSALINKNVLPPPPARPITKIRRPPPYVHLRAAAAAARPLIAADIWRNIFSKTHCVRSIWGASVRMKIYARQSLLCRENYSSAALTHIMSRAYMRVCGKHGEKYGETATVALLATAREHASLKTRRALYTSGAQPMSYFYSFRFVLSWRCFKDSILEAYRYIFVRYGAYSQARTNL